MILRKSVPGPPMCIFDGHIVRFYGRFCQTSFALRTTVIKSLGNDLLAQKNLWTKMGSYSKLAALMLNKADSKCAGGIILILD